MTKEVKERSQQKYLTRSKTFYFWEYDLPSTKRARHLLQHDIFREQLKKAVKKEQKQKNKKKIR